MHTTFVFRLISDDAQQAKHAAFECINCLDQLESDLSRFLENSDVAQINDMEAGQKLFISEDTYACMKIAMEMHRLTGGLFDITLGKQIEHAKKNAESKSPEIRGRLALDPERPAVHCIEAGREIDLGGIGKGYALDKLKGVCEDWEIPAGLLSAGASTHLSFGERSWPIILNGDHINQTVKLQNAALSVSGTDTQGGHIISPFEDTDNGAYNRIWVVDATAATADAWSTAAMLMQPDEIHEHSGRIRIILDE